MISGMCQSSGGALIPGCGCSQAEGEQEHIGKELSPLSGRAPHWEGAQEQLLLLQEVQQLQKRNLRGKIPGFGVSSLDLSLSSRADPLQPPSPGDSVPRSCDFPHSAPRLLPAPWKQLWGLTRGSPPPQNHKNALVEPKPPEPGCSFPALPCQALGTGSREQAVPGAGSCRELQGAAGAAPSPAQIHPDPQDVTLTSATSAR